MLQAMARASLLLVEPHIKTSWEPHDGSDSSEPGSYENLRNPVPVLVLGFQPSLRPGIQDGPDDSLRIEPFGMIQIRRLARLPVLLDP